MSNSKRLHARISTVSESASIRLEPFAASRFTSPRSSEDWHRFLALHVFPYIGTHSVSDIEPSDVLEVLNRTWRKKPAAAEKARDHIRTVMQGW